MRLRTITSRQQSRRYPGLVVGAVAVLALTACTGSAEDAANDEESSSDSTPVAAEGGNDEAGDTVTIGFSAPAADHGWMAAITNNVRDLAEQPATWWAVLLVAGITGAGLARFGPENLLWRRSTTLRVANRRQKTMLLGPWAP